MNILFGQYRQRSLNLLLLNPQQSFHVREMARLTQTTPGTLHKELSQLAEAGLLLREKQGNQIRYRANTQHPVYNELAGLFRKTMGAVSVLKDHLQTLSDQISVAFIFGSVARGSETATSDVDIVLVGDATFAQAVQALYPAQNLLGREINPIIYTAKEFAYKITSQEPFVLKLLTEPKLFVIGDEHDLGKLAGHSKAPTL
jgi:predicted nucleotidyltransferase